MFRSSYKSFRRSVVAYVVVVADDVLKAVSPVQEPELEKKQSVEQHDSIVEQYKKLIREQVRSGSGSGQAVGQVRQCFRSGTGSGQALGQGFRGQVIHRVGLGVLRSGTGSSQL